MKKFLLHISGPSCSGKTTLSKILAEKIPDMFTVSSDKLKWQISNYDREKHGHMRKDIVFGLLETVCKLPLSILLDAPIFNEEDYKHIRTLAETHGHEYVGVRLETPHDILIERYTKRLADSKSTGMKLSIKSVEQYQQLLGVECYVPEHTAVLDTYEMNSEDIANKILELLK